MTATTHPVVTDRLMLAARLRAAENLAVDYTQGKIGDLGTRLLALAPRLSPYAQQQRFETLVQAIQYRQDVHDGQITTGEVERHLAHPDVLADHAQQLVEDALADLVGGGL
ncbi:MAG: hypothetical protein ACRDPR_12540 [Nocardioidaceae bacterium]